MCVYIYIYVYIYGDRETMNYSVLQHVPWPPCATVNRKTSRFKDLHTQRGKKGDTQSNH